VVKAAPQVLPKSKRIKREIMIECLVEEPLLLTAEALIETDSTPRIAMTEKTMHFRRNVLRLEMTIQDPPPFTTIEDLLIVGMTEETTADVGVLIDRPCH
jgi:hypothetical protein